MIHLGEMLTRDCGGLDRRAFLQVGGTGLLGLSLPELFRAQAHGLGQSGKDISCIFLFLWGGPPHQDTFDLKPGAPDGIRGPYKQIATQVPGIQFGELLPRLASHNELFTVVRSATHRETEHPRAAHFMMTGNQVIRGSEWPNMGAAVSKFVRGRKNPIGSVVVGPRLVDQPITPNGQDGGFLGNGYSPFRVADPLQPLEKIAALSPTLPLSAQRAALRERLYRSIESYQKHVESNQTEVHDSAYERAFALATSKEAKRAFDLSLEAEAIRDKYGRYTFGQGVLMARRLVEAGVRFVQVNWREHPIREYGFDNHGDNFNKLKNHQAPQIDQTVTALLDDLRDRGLLDTTLVFMTGEFGRTPKINANAGRDHWPFVFSYLIAGAGIPGGRVIGASDQFAAYPADEPVSPENTAASVYKLLGLDLGQLQNRGSSMRSKGSRTCLHNCISPSTIWIGAAFEQNCAAAKDAGHAQGAPSGSPFCCLREDRLRCGARVHHRLDHVIMPVQGEKYPIRLEMALYALLTDGRGKHEFAIELTHFDRGDQIGLVRSPGVTVDLGSDPTDARNGKAFAPVKVLPPMAGDLSEPIQMPALQLILTLQAEAKPAHVALDVLRLVGALSRLERELGGAGMVIDEDQSRTMAASGNLRLVLTANRTFGAEGRLAQIVERQILEQRIDSFAKCKAQVIKVA